MPFDAKSLMDLLPILASVGGNPHYRESVLQGYNTQRRQFEQEALLRQQAARQDQMAQAEIANRQADNTRADQQLQLQQQNADLSHLLHFREAAGQQAAQIADTATDPLTAQNELTAQSIGLRKDFGVPASVSMPTPNMAGMISRRQKKHAEDLYAQMEKRYGPEAMANDATLTIVSDEFGKIKPSQLRAMFETPAFDQSGAPAAPYVKPVAQPQGSEKERAAQLLGKIQDAETAGDAQTSAKLKREYQNLLKATRDIGLADNVTPQGVDPKLQRLIDTQTRGFDQQPMVRSIQKQAEAVQFVQSLDPNTTNPADDQGLIYAFAKAMDPDSVVREGEYNTVQKYAQSWADTFGFKAQRIFSNTAFLTPQARQNMKQTIEKRFVASKMQYDNLRKSYGSKIDNLTGRAGSGEEQLTNYGGGFPEVSPAAQGMSDDDAIIAARKAKGAGGAR